MRALLIALTLLAPTLLALAGCENPPFRPNHMSDFYDTRTSGGVQGTLLGPQGIPQTIVIPTP